MEAWLSMQQALSHSGLVPASAGNERHTIAHLHNASSTISQGLVALWSGKSAAEAHAILRQPDVSVTNQSDKMRQLPKIASLNETIRQTLERHEKCDAALQALAAAMVTNDAAALRAALTSAQVAQVAPANLSVAIDVAHEAGVPRAILAALDQVVADAVWPEVALVDVGVALKPPAASSIHYEVEQVLNAFTEAQLAATDAFAKARQLAEDKGVEVRLTNRRNTVSVVARSTADGTSGRIMLEKAMLTHVTDGGRDSAGCGGGACCGACVLQ